VVTPIEATWFKAVISKVSIQVINYGRQSFRLACVFPKISDLLKDTPQTLDGIFLFVALC